MKKAGQSKGFTLVEMLLVVVIIAILAGIVYVAINPGRQISQTNDAQRQSDLKTILDAVHQYGIDNRGVLPSAITATATEISDGTNLIDLCDDLVPLYVAGLPVDPTDADATYTDCATAYATGYTIMVDTNNRVTVAAPSAEITTPMSVTR